VGLAVAVLGSMFLSFPIGAYSFYSNSLNGTSTEATFSFLPVFVVGMLFYLPVPQGALSLGYVFFYIWASFVALFVLLLKGPWYNLIKALKNVRSDRSVAIYSNGGLVVGMVFPSLLLATVLIEMLLNRAGIPVGSLPDIGARDIFFSISYAPIVEEVGFRATIIGLVAALVAHRAKGGWRSLKAIWHPYRALNELRVESWKQAGIYAAIFLSAALFGVQHVLQGGGWEVGKALSSFVVGLALGLVYFTHGLPAAIMLHWGFNYFQGSFYYFDLVRGLPPLDSSAEFSSLEALSYSQFYVDGLLIVTGIVVYALVAYLVGKSLMERRAGRRAST